MVHDRIRIFRIWYYFLMIFFSIWFFCINHQKLIVFWFDSNFLLLLKMFVIFFISLSASKPYYTCSTHRAIFSHFLVWQHIFQGCDLSEVKMKMKFWALTSLNRYREYTTLGVYFSPSDIIKNQGNNNHRTTQRTHKAKRYM